MNTKSIDLKNELDPVQSSFNITLLKKSKGNIDALTLSDFIDQKVLQSMMEEFYKLTHILSAILDISGNILVAVGWQDICTKFHRCHPETQRNCLESDTTLSSGVPEGTFKAYRCKNNLWDMATPIVVSGRHIGNIFIGQFFYDDEIPDYELFRRQARKYGFDEKKYIEALDRVPRLSHETVNAAMKFFAELAGMISSLSYSTLTLSQALSRQESVLHKLSHSESKLRQAQYLAGIGDFTWEIATDEVTWSDGMYQLLKYDKNETMDYEKVNAAIHHPDDLERITKWLMDGIASGKKFLTPTEYRLIRKDKKSIHVQLNGQIEYHQGTAIRLFGTCLDITERKRAEEEKKNLETQLLQAQKIESVGRLAGGVAHDFNNMLGVILGHADMILEELDPALPIYAGLQEIKKAGERSADLTRQLLAFARKQIVAPKVLDLNHTLDGMLQMLGRLIGEDIDIAWLPGKTLGAVNIDPSQIDQMLANLCVNARDAIADVGKITIETGNAVFDDDYCSKHVGFVPGEFVLLAVSDNGRGMDRKILAQVFEPFFTTKDQGKGTGLGLATVYGIVKQNNGFINVYSEPDQGTTFRIYLPRHMGKSGNMCKKNSTEPDVGGQETILLVEDEPTILRMTRMMLERLGYTVVPAATPGQAIRLAREYAGHLHLLMTDVVMPEMNGRELAENILSIYPDINRLFMSGYTANVIAHHGVLEKGLNFIQKPFSKKDLAIKVKEALSTGN